VYRARVVEGGEETEVAVKVVHPGLRQNLHRVSSSVGTFCVFWLNLAVFRIRIQDLMTKNYKNIQLEKNLISLIKNCH
jgi:hypothetical protein